MTRAAQPASEPTALMEVPASIGAGIASEVSAALASLDERPVDEHPDVFESVHERLRTSLSGIDHV